MDTRKEVFFENLIIDDDLNHIDIFLMSKGIEKHIILKEKLLNWIEGNTIEYSMIASTYRYDKRIRMVLFKYISYLEEFYRAIILDEYRNKPKRKYWKKELQERLDEYDNDLNYALEHIEFSTLLYQSKIMPKRLKGLFNFPNKKYLDNNITALITLRNAVMHNKFLLLYRGFETCFVNGVDDGKSSSLKANILNLISFLPEEVGQKCKKEINEARNEGKNTGTKWNLPSVVIIDL